MTREAAGPRRSLETPGGYIEEMPGYTLHKDQVRSRLRRIEGQVRGLQRMVDEERYCPEILTQMASVQEALRAVARSLMRNHLKHCVATAHGSANAEGVYNELLELIFRQSR